MSDQIFKKKEIIEETTFFSTDSNHGRIVALAVKEACKFATQYHQGWEAARKLILQNNLLTNEEKVDLIKLIYKS